MWSKLFNGLSSHGAFEYRIVDDGCLNSIYFYFIKQKRAKNESSILFAPLSCFFTYANTSQVEKTQ